MSMKTLCLTILCTSVAEDFLGGGGSEIHERVGFWKSPALETVGFPQTACLTEGIV